MGSTGVEILSPVCLVTKLPNTAPLVMTMPGLNRGIQLSDLLSAVWTDSAYSPYRRGAHGWISVVPTPSGHFRRIRSSYSWHFGLTGVGGLSHNRPPHHWQRTSHFVGVDSAGLYTTPDYGGFPRGRTSCM